MVSILVPMSVGEVADRITILRLRLQHGQDVEAELRALLEAALVDAHAGKAPLPAKEDTLELQEVNALLWEAEDAVRRCNVIEGAATFMQTARSIVALNDRRAQIKRRINEKAGSAVEEKIYT
jgi:plasmid stability protein